MRIFLLSILLISLNTVAQNDSTIQLLFVGDVMGHDTQIAAAKAEAGGKGYNYDSCFYHISDLFESVDYSIANLECTLAGAPYKGYPQFSSPDELLFALKRSGVDAFITANNHLADRGTKGLKRTLLMLDSLKFPHTGVFSDWPNRLANTPMVLEKNGIKIGVLNYTYGTNGLRVSKPAQINYIDSVLIASDVNVARQVADKVVLCMHWGREYEHTPHVSQTGMVKYCKSLGVDVIVGSHPHVLQPFVWNKEDSIQNFVAYSLGNFVSNQRTQPRDGGAALRLEFEKDSVGNVILKDAGYYLTWVHTPTVKGQRMFYVAPVAKFESDTTLITDTFQRNKMKSYATKMRKLLKKVNKNVPELKEY